MEGGILMSGPWEGTYYMLRINKADQEVIKEKIREGRIEGAALGRENFVDIIVKKMKELGIIEDLKHVVADKRADNAHIPLELIWALGIDAKWYTRGSRGCLTPTPIYSVACPDDTRHPHPSEPKVRRLFFPRKGMGAARNMVYQGW
jgi:hypothetical protein